MNYFTADYHFGHEGIIEMCERPFKNVTIMDKELIKCTNRVITDNDDLWILGDFSIKTETHKGYLREIVQKIKGRKHLIMGNHDIKNPWLWVDIGFQSVHAPYFELGDLVLVHDPALSRTNVKYKFLCGHVHTLFLKQGNCLNVGVDMHFFTPVSENAVRRHYEI